MTRDERQEIARVKWIKNKCIGTLVQPTGCGFLKILQFNRLKINFDKSKNFITIAYINRYDKRYSDQTIILEFHKKEGIDFINYIYNDANVYLDRKFKLYEFFKNGSRSVKEFAELQLDNIGESPEKDNTEINSETKESESSYSIDLEPDKSE